MTNRAVLSIGLSVLIVAGTACQSAEILRDPWGIPHIFAESEEGGFFCLGYACAEDRLLQMELIRRKGAGRLAEVFGPQCVDADRQARIAGHADYAPLAMARLPERWQKAMISYAAGVNVWVKQHPGDVAQRFRPLGITPEAWTPADCLVAARGILSLGSPFNEASIQEYHRFRDLVAQVGEAAAAHQAGMTIDDAGAVVPESEMAKDKEVYARLKAMPRTPGFNLRGTAAEPRKMSHAWAVSGRRSTTGKPILESDPQLPLSSPPFFYEFHLVAGRIDARGLGIPGCPGLFIGFNRRIAWGGSALGVDSIVTFLDRLTADGKGFVYEGKAVPFERRLEKIEVNGGQTVVQEVLTSRHGTVFNSLVRQPRPGEAYLCYDAQTVDAGTSVRMMLEVMEAANWGQFRQALAHYYYPGLHVVYADADGNLGYQTTVHRPLTTKSPRRALEGWTGRDEVNRRIPLDELPHMLNPDAGYISHANNLPVGSWYPYDLGLSTGGTGDTGRSLRLRQLLDGDRKFSLDDFERVLHSDDVDPLIVVLLPVARKVAEEDKISDLGVLQLLKALEGWDMHAATTDRFPAARGLENTITPYRGAGLQNVYGAGGGGVAHLARDVAARFARDGSTPENPAVRAYLINWLRSATGAGGLGRGGATDERTARKSADRLVERRSVERTITIPYQKTIPHNLPTVDSSLDIVSPPLACLNQDTIWSQPGNLYTQIVDLSNLDNSRSIIAPGNAEDAAGRFRTNQIELWVKGTTHPAPLSRARIAALGGSRTKVAPTAYSGPLASPPRTVTNAERAARFIPAIPPAAETIEAKPKLPGRKPDDPTLEAAFRYLLRNEHIPAEIDAKLEEVQRYVAGQATLRAQLHEALVLGIYLMEEANAGRLKIPYGTPHALKRMRALTSGDPSQRMTLAEIERALAASPPAWEHRDARAAIAASLDKLIDVQVRDAMTDEDRTRLQPLVEFYRRRVDQGLDALERTHVTEGVRIFKFYSSSLVLKSAQGTVAVDSCQGPVNNGGEPESRDARRTGFYWTPQQRDRLARLVDVSLITHRHHDHADYSLSRRLKAQGKPVVGPAQLTSLWKDLAGAIRVPNYDQVERVGPVEIYAMLGRQCAKSELDADGQRVGVPNRDNPDADSESVVYLIRLGGVVFLQAAENHLPAGDWLERGVQLGFEPDVVLSIGQYQGQRSVDAVLRRRAPRFRIPVHEYELTHDGGGNRTSPWFTGSGRHALEQQRSMPLFWGENFYLTRTFLAQPAGAGTGSDE